MRRPVRFRTLKTVLVIVLAGVVPISILARRHARAVDSRTDPGDGDGKPELEQGRASPSPAEIVQRVQLASTRVRLEALENKVADLQANGANAAAPAQAKPAETSEQGFKKNQDEFAAAIASHEREPLDLAWSQRASASFQKSLEGLSKTNQFTLIGVDCRKESCLATVEWENYQTAFSNYGGIVNHSYELPCGAEMILAMPPDQNARYRSNAIFSCAQN